MYNELSVYPSVTSKHEALEKIKKFALTFSEARKKGFARIRSNITYSDIKPTESYSLQDFLYDKTLPNKEFKNYKDILFGSIIQPFINDDDDEVVDAYIQSNFHFEIDGNQHECLGLTAAFFYETLSISFGLHPTWENSILSITNVVDGVSKKEQVYNVYSNDCFQTQLISKFVENSGQLVLQITSLEPNQKSITLFGDHHGKKYLQALADKLVNSPYVIEIKSTNFGGNSFIRKVYPDGILEIVILSRDERFALWVKTTGRNFRETKAIAQILREKYS